MLCRRHGGFADVESLQGLASMRGCTDLAASSPNQTEALSEDQEHQQTHRAEHERKG